ncbi:MAG: FkbM family methyltransferase [Pirellulales bacterium]
MVHTTTVVEPRVTMLTPGELLVRTHYGFQMVVPGWNTDVAPGIVRDGIIEPWTNALFLSGLNFGDTVVNVGANFGFYALLAGSRVDHTGKVYAVEANPAVFPYLVKSAYWSGMIGRLKLFNCAAVSPEMHERELEFMFDPQYIGNGQLDTGVAGLPTMNDCMWSHANMHMALDENRMFAAKGIYTKVKTQGRMLDTIVPSTEIVSTMLIDAEGSESYVVAGAKETIRRNPNMAIIMEWDSSVYHKDAQCRPHIDAMWDFLLNEMKFRAFRVSTDNYRGVGSMPDLIECKRSQLYETPHGDFLLKK